MASGLAHFIVGTGLLAMAPCQPTSMVTRTPPSRASPAPTGIGGVRASAFHCGSEPARDGAVSADINVDLNHRHRGQARLPQGSVASGLAHFIVGAGLLAKAPCQPTSMLTRTPPSRASPAPRGIGGVRASAFHCGSEPARDSAVSADIHVDPDTAIAGKPSSHRDRWRQG